MDPNATLAAMLAAVAAMDVMTFDEFAGYLADWLGKGGFLPDDLKTIADDLRDEARNLPHTTGRREEDEANEVDTLDFRLYIRPDGSLDLQTGDASYDTDHRGYCGASSVSAYDRMRDIRYAVCDALSQAIDGARDGLASLGEDGDERIARRVVDCEAWYDVHDNDGTYLATVATIDEAREILSDCDVLPLDHPNDDGSHTLAVYTLVGGEYRQTASGSATLDDLRRLYGRLISYAMEPPFGGSGMHDRYIVDGRAVSANDPASLAWLRGMLRALGVLV